MDIYCWKYRYETVQSESVIKNQQTYWSQECFPESKFDQPQRSRSQECFRESKFDQPQRSRVMSAKQWDVQEPE